MVWLGPWPVVFRAPAAGQAPCYAVCLLNQDIEGTVYRGVGSLRGYQRQLAKHTGPSGAPGNCYHPERPGVSWQE